MAHIVLASGVRNGVLLAFATGTVLAVLALLVNIPASLIVANATIVWLPVIVLAWLVRLMRSITLTFQVSVIAAAAIVIVFFVAVGDPVAYWNGVISESVALFREAGANEYADRLLESQDAIVPQMTMLMVFVGWSMYTLVLLLGYALFQHLPDKTAVYGSFRDLNMGRVLAGVMAVASVIAVLSGSMWVQNVAFLILVTFWLQGLAIMHWLHKKKQLPAIVLVVTYVLLVPLNAMMMIAFSIVGYLDAWFNFRARSVTGQA